MNTHIEEYLDAVCRQIKYKQIHPSVREELAGHIQELQEAYMSLGDDEDAAIEKALAQMGNPQEVGQKLHKTHKPQTDWLTLGLIALLICFGTAVLLNMQTWQSNYYNFADRQIFHILIALGIAAILYFANYTKLFQHSFLFYSIGIILNIYILLQAPGSDTWWFHIGGFAIDGGALILCLYLLSLAGLAIHWQTEHKGDSWKLIAAMGLAVALFMNLNMAKAFILAVVCLPLLHYSVSHAAWCTNPNKQLTILYSMLAAIFLAGSFMMIAIEPYRAARFAAFLHPENDPLGDGYVPMLQRTVMENTSWFQGMPYEDAFYETENGPRFIVPEAHTDLVFTYILGRYGWGVAAALCFVMAALICKMVCLSGKIQDRYGKSLCYGITAFFAAQIICNILMNLTLFPYTSMSLPFISYGGSMMLLDMALMAIFLNVYRRKNLIHETAPLPNKKRLLPHVEVKVTWK